MKRMQKYPDMLEEYDFSKVVRGKYAKRYSEGTNVVVIDPDVARVFPDHDLVNQALRSLVKIIRRQKKLASSGKGRGLAVPPQEKIEGTWDQKTVVD